MGPMGSLGPMGSGPYGLSGSLGHFRAHYYDYDCHDYEYDYEYDCDGDEENLINSSAKPIPSAACVLSFGGVCVRCIAVFISC